MSFGFLGLPAIFRLQRLCYRHPKRLLLLAVAITLSVGAAAPLVKTSNDPFLLFGHGSEHRQKFNQQKAEFGHAAQALMMLSVKTLDDQSELLRAERHLSEILATPDDPRQPIGLISFSSVTQLLPALGHPLEFTSIEDVALLIDEQPRLNNTFFNKTQTAVMLSLNLRPLDQSDTGLQSAFERQQSLGQHIETSFPDVRVAILGSVSLSEALRDAMTFDRKYLFPLTLVINFIVLWLAFGNLRITVTALTASMGSVIMTLGIAGWSGHVFATAAVSSFSIVMTLTVASLIHVIHAIGQRQRRLPFQTFSAVMLASFRKLCVPIIVAHATTAAGFLSLNWADAPAFRAMGNLVAIGLGFSLLIVLFVAPVVLNLGGKPQIIRDSGLRKISRFTVFAWAKAPRFWALAMGMISVLMVLGLFKTVFDDQFSKFFTADHPLRQNLQQVQDNMGWSERIDLVLRYEPDQLLRAETFATLETLLADIQTLDGISEIRSPLPVLQHCLETRSSPFLGNLADVPAKLLNYCIRSNWFVSESAGNSTFAAGFSAMRLSIMLPNSASATIRHLAESIEAKTLDHGFTSDTASVSGLNVMSAYLSKINTQSMLEGSAIAMLIVSILIGVFLRSLKLALLSIIPNFLPAMAALGIWVWFNTEIGMAASVIAAITFGIVVDDTIHILYALKKDRRPKTTQNVKRVLQEVMPGVITTTAVLGAGFALIMLSGFAVNQQLGFLTASTIFVAFLFDLLVLPSLFLVFMGKEPRKER